METPVLNHLNRSQQRALILRDQLQYLEPQHLNTFLDGVTNDEPPTYRKVNGKIQPELTKVTLSKRAKVFDLGNVIFPNENNALHRVSFIVDKGQFEIRATEAIPRDDADLFSAPIHSFVARNMLQLYEVKFRAIHARMNKINEARDSAYQMLCQPTAKFHQGASLARLETEGAKLGESHVPNTLKRQNGDPIAKHSTNKRKRIGMEAIPDDFKNSFLSKLSPQIQSSIFSEMVKSAVPNYNDLMMAAWNVISIYRHVGDALPDLHMAMVDLESVLKEINNEYRNNSSTRIHKRQVVETIGPSDQIVAEENQLNYRQPRERQNEEPSRIPMVNKDSFTARTENQERLQGPQPIKVPKIKKEPNDMEGHSLIEKIGTQSRSDTLQETQRSQKQPGPTPSATSRSTADQHGLHTTHRGIKARTQSGEVYIRQRVDSGESRPQGPSKYPGVDLKQISEELNRCAAEKAAKEKTRSSSAPFLQTQNRNRATPINGNSPVTTAQKFQRENRQDKNVSPKVVVKGLSHPDLTAKDNRLAKDDYCDNPQGIRYGQHAVDMASSCQGSPRQSLNSTEGVPTARMFPKRDDENGASH